MYESFLNGIRRTKTASVTPAYWNDFVNKVVLALIDPLEDVLGLNQRIDDLQGFYVITLDGVPYPTIRQIAIGDDFVVFPLPVLGYNQLYDGSGSLYTYPKYKRLMKVWTRIATLVNRDYVYGDWIECRPVKSDYEDRYSDNYYLEADTDSHLLYSIEEGGENHHNTKVLKIKGSTSLQDVKLRYLRLPREIWLDEQNYNDNVDNTEHVAGQGSVPPDFSNDFINKVVDVAIETYLKRLNPYNQKK
jgi:hypothetical protein